MHTPAGEPGSVLLRGVFRVGVGLYALAFVTGGFGLAESMVLVTAVISIHHFVVDAYIWRLRRDPGYRDVAAAPAAA